MAPLNGASTAAELGLTTAANGNTITGTDVNPVNVPGIFTDLENLRNALENNDTNGITAAAAGLTNDAQTVTNVSGAACAPIAGPGKPLVGPEQPDAGEPDVAVDVPGRELHDGGNAVPDAADEPAGIADGDRQHSAAVAAELSRVMA